MIRTLKNYYHWSKAVAASVFYGFPSHKLITVGVTGTDGKTTTATLLYHILSEAGYKTLLVSTIGAYMHGKYFETGLHTTTPSSFEIQRLLKKAVENGMTHAVLEVTSHALDQNRVWGIPFDIGIVTNVTREHLDYHKTYKKYIRAKQKLLECSKLAIINKDDSSFSSFTKAIPETKLLTYSLDDTSATICAKTSPFKTKLIGEFNRQNVLAAVLAAQNLGISNEVIKKSIEVFEPPAGRQELIYDKKFRIMVDFAHTPNSFLKVLPVVRERTKGRLIHIFGSAGQRDAGKRPLMGEASSEFADVIILTAEDPRRESVDEINSQIENGFIPGFSLLDSVVVDIKTPKSYFKINQRYEAIEKAIAIAKPLDTILITGKGHEKSMNLDGVEIPWDDKKETLAILKKLNLL